MRRLTKKQLTASFLSAVFIFLISGYFMQKQLIDIYKSNESFILKDRKNEEIAVLQNKNGYWARYSDLLPDRFKQLLLQKEDKYFYWHFGFNPISSLEAVFGRLRIGDRKASSTITQQLVKILLKKELERNLKNKTVELFYVLALETYQSKDEILKMYANSIYFGNQIQGTWEAGKYYFDSAPDLLSDGQILQLLATISGPNENNPAKNKNKEMASSLAKSFKINEEDLILKEAAEIKENLKQYSHFDKSYFEISSFLNNDFKSSQLTVDKELSGKIREIIRLNLEELKVKDANNAAAIVIKLPGNEILSLTGSPDPLLQNEGYKINMLQETRPIGSTIKPFIYLKAFEKGLRPYTLALDKEYKYITALGFPLYPKNFDYQYRGEVNLHYALSNSLNVPSVKVLEYVGLQNFYDFLEKDLEFKPIQDLNNYQLGIALGTLEMNLLDLSKYFTVFPDKGILKELKIYETDNENKEKIIADEKYVQLINKILNDRKTGIEQFGLKSWLNLFQENYALKTGTSRDFRDSWIIGYTPDFLVSVWVGNADNSPMDEISGQEGAGRIWAEIMELLLNSEYNKKTPFDFSSIKEFQDDSNNIEYGLADDNFEKSLNALKETENSLILNPHSDDTFILEKNTQIILKAKESVEWFVNDEFLGQGERIIFSPEKSGQYRIKAKSDGSQETVAILVNDQ